MATAFAQLLDRVNATALARFGGQHTLDGVAVQGDFVLPGKTFTISDFQEKIQARTPLLIVADGDVPAAPVGKPAVCDGVNYTIEEARPDGFGLTVLELQKVL